MKTTTNLQPSVYVGTYGKYNNGSLFGKWVNLTDFTSKEEFYKYGESLGIKINDLQRLRMLANTYMQKNVEYQQVEFEHWHQQAMEMSNKYNELLNKHPNDKI